MSVCVCVGGSRNRSDVVEDVAVDGAITGKAGLRSQRRSLLLVNVYRTAAGDGVDAARPYGRASANRTAEAAWAISQVPA